MMGQVDGKKPLLITRSAVLTTAPAHMTKSVTMHRNNPK